MTMIEDRLREQLPELADALIPTQAARSAPRPDDRPPTLSPASPVTRRPGRLLAAAAVLVLIGAAAIYLTGWRDSPDDELAIVAGPAVAAADVATAGPGTWTVLSDAPIEARPYAVAAWIGTEAIFWAGSSLDRGFAYTDGAVYDPATDTWRSFGAPGWGHPGLTSTLFDGELYVLAKGSGARFDPATELWSDMPPVENMFLAATVATNTAVYGLGPAGSNPAGQPDLAIARYDEANNGWIYGPVFEGTDQLSNVVMGLSQLESSTHWDGSQIIVWRGVDGGIAFDPANETWEGINPPQASAGTVVESVATVTDHGFAVVSAVDTGEGLIAMVALRAADDWVWLDLAIPMDGFEGASVFSAENWLAVFTAEGAPVTIDVHAGTWHRHDNGPLAGLRGPSAVWTGEQLIVWGGKAADSSIPAGAAWRPPSDGAPAG